MSEQLDTTELKRLHHAATPGIWMALDGYIGCKIHAGCQNSSREVLRDCKEQDAAFIAAAKNSMPALLDRIAELEQSGARVETLLLATIKDLQADLEEANDARDLMYEEWERDCSKLLPTTFNPPVRPSLRMVEK